MYPIDTANVWMFRFGCWDVSDGSSRWPAVVVRLVVLGHSSAVRPTCCVHTGILNVVSSLLSAHQLRVPHKRLQFLVGFLLLLACLARRFRNVHTTGKAPALPFLTESRNVPWQLDLGNNKLFN